MPSSVTQHYDTLLAPIYLWMAGGFDAALAQGVADITPLVGEHAGRPVAIDLGAGFGMHAIPLAQRGYAVTAIDTSAMLLDELRQHARGLDIDMVGADLLDFRRYCASPADLILCMGDTITHLEARGDVERLFVEISGALAPAGRAVITFRDYTSPPEEEARFVLVRSDANRIHTCFLEQDREHMVVHDLVHEREGGTWRLRVGSYRKLRLAPAWVREALERAGLDAVVDLGPRGMIRVIASRRKA